MAEYDKKALFKLGYGLYVLTVNDGGKDNGMICNTVSQIASSPDRIAVSVNKANFSHDMIKRTGVMNVNCLTFDAPFEIFKRFGFASGRDTDKFAGTQVFHSANGCAILNAFINSFISLKVENYVDMGSHGLFICQVTDAVVMSDKPGMTYAYYHENVKPKPQKTSSGGWICTVCGYIYEGQTLPQDFVCPICKHPASDFEPVK